MQSNEQLIHDFYTAFRQKNAAGMNTCYSDDIVFYDPVFELLENGRAKDMWEMLCANAKDLDIQFSNIKDLGDDYYTCDWVASYTFSQTGRKVVNKVRANMKLKDGRIIEHSDAFSLHKWAAQALGFSGWLLGWNRFYQQQIKNKAKRNLMRYIEKKEAAAN
ncbi:MAG: nuclear transport factor 2 family protein [Ferruginibacter sp.]